MQVMIIEVNVKPEKRAQFIDVITDDATHSEADEPGCLRFDVLQDADDENKFFFYEVYKDEAAMLAHRETPHFARFAAVIHDLISEPIGRHQTRNVVPGDSGWR